MVPLRDDTENPMLKDFPEGFNTHSLNVCLPSFFPFFYTSPRNDRTGRSREPPSRETVPYAEKRANQIKSTHTEPRKALHCIGKAPSKLHRARGSFVHGCAWVYLPFSGSVCSHSSAPLRDECRMWANFDVDARSYTGQGPRTAQRNYFASFACKWLAEVA